MIDQAANHRRCRFANRRGLSRHPGGDHCNSALSRSSNICTSSLGNPAQLRLGCSVALLQRLRVPRAVAVVGVVLFAFAIIFALGSLIATQLNRLAGDLPRYQTTIQSKIQSVRGVTGGSSTLERAAGMLQDLGKELDKPKTAIVADAPNADLLGLGGSKTLQPVQVEVRQPDPSALENLRSLIAPLLSPLATTGIIVIFVIFILLQREDLRNRLIRLAGSHDLQRTTAALDDAAGRLSRLFLNQLLINTGFAFS